ncbi:3-hydroxypropionyl-coenzyme A dehydratase [Diplonema papillatum]|nr:3-hydroxypropionyl-coenzyme A dehydratase [Diplonema papillatum]
MQQLAQRTSGGLVRTGYWTAAKGVKLGLIVIDNPAKRNALCGQGMATLRQGVEALAALENVAAVLLCGTGGRFCAGAEMPVLVDGGFQKHMQDTLRLMRAQSFVTYALVEGHAIGGGAELAMAADCRIWTETSSLQFVQTAMGIPTGWGGAHWLAEAVGRPAALHLLASGQRLATFEQASAHGVAHSFTAAPTGPTTELGLPPLSSPGTAAPGASESHLSPTALAAAAELLKLYQDRFPRAVASVKAIVDAAPEDRLATEEELFGKLWKAPDHVAALTAAKMI